MDLDQVISFITTNFDAISTIIMAGATLALAYFSLQSIRQSEKQIENSKIQTDIILSQQQPDIQITQRSFDGNKLILSLKNAGEGTAYDIAVLCAFHITKPLMWSKGRVITPRITEPRIIESVMEIQGEPKEFLNFLLKTKEKNTLEPGELVTFPINDLFFNYLPGKSSAVAFQCEPCFYLKTKKEGFWDVPPYIARPVSYSELRTLLSNNNITEISVIFHLLSKDRLQNVLFHGKICDFIINLSEDETLEMSSQRGTPGPYPLEKDDIKTRFKCLDYDIYRRGKYIVIDDSKK